MAMPLNQDMEPDFQALEHQLPILDLIVLLQVATSNVFQPMLMDEMQSLRRLRHMGLTEALPWRLTALGHEAVCWWVGALEEMGFQHATLKQFPTAPTSPTPSASEKMPG